MRHPRWLRKLNKRQLSRFSPIQLAGLIIWRETSDQIERLSCTWFAMNHVHGSRQHCSLAWRVKPYVARLQRTVPRPVSRVNSRALPFLSTLPWKFPKFGKFHGFIAWMYRILKIRAPNRAKCSMFRTTLKAHFQRGSRMWFEIEPRSLYQSMCNVFRAEPRTAKTSLLMQKAKLVLSGLLKCWCKTPMGAIHKMAPLGSAGHFRTQVHAGSMAGCVRQRKTDPGRAPFCSFCLNMAWVILADDLHARTTWKNKLQTELEHDIPIFFGSMIMSRVEHRTEYSTAERLVRWHGLWLSAAGDAFACVLFWPLFSPQKRPPHLAFWLFWFCVCGYWLLLPFHGHLGSARSMLPDSLLYV